MSLGNCEAGGFFLFNRLISMNQVQLLFMSLLYPVYRLMLPAIVVSGSSDEISGAPSARGAVDRAECLYHLPSTVSDHDEQDCRSYFIIRERCKDRDRACETVSITVSWNHRGYGPSEFTVLPTLLFLYLLCLQYTL